MTSAHQAAQSERRIFRAALFALAVLAQLLLPAIVLRAQAVAAELCITGGDGSDSPSSTGHAHDQQCAHCRLHNCSPLTPPQNAAIALAALLAPETTDLAPAMSFVTVKFAQPPPTGPPAA